MANNMKINATFASNDSSGRASEIFTLKSLSNSSLIRWETSEDVVFELRSDSDKEFRKTIKNNDITTFIEGDDLYIANPIPSAAQTDGFSITATACLTCVGFKNAKKAVESINKKAFLGSLSSDKKINEDDPHAQGSNLYIDKNGRKHFIVSYDTRDDKVCGGYLVIFSEPMCDKTTPRVMEVKCNNSKYNHPGSFQIVGDFLFLPVEEYRGSESGRENGAEVHVYDLSPLANEYKMPEKVDFCTIEDHRAGALGATDEWIAINDQKNLYLYQYKLANDENGDNSQLRLYMKFVKQLTIEKTQGIGLVKQLMVGNHPDTTHQVLYLIGLVTRDSTKDYICYYRIAITKGIEEGNVTSIHFEGGDKDNKTENQVWTEPGNGGTGDESIHLKYGGGVYLSDNDTISCLGTGRAIRTDMKFNFNIFSNVDRVELDCALENIEDEEPRASQNFSILNFTHDYCRFYVYDKKGNIVTPDLFIRRDVSGKRDVGIRKVDYTLPMPIRNVNSDTDLDKTPMYLAYDAETMGGSEDKGFLRVVIEGVTENEKK